MKRRNPLAAGFLATTMAVSQIGCGVEVATVAIWLGQVILYTAAVRATINLVDQVIGANQQKVGSEVEPNASDPDRGIIRQMRVGKTRSGRPTGEMVEFENVPVVKNSSGRWIVEKYYCDQIMAPKLNAAE